MSDREKLLLVDANSLIFQAFHALPPLTTRDGLPTNAVHGFASMLLRLLEEQRPAALALAFDTKEPTFRHQQYAEYKAHRPPIDEALLQQLPLIDKLIEAFRWPSLRLPGYEADDILGCLAVRAGDQWDVYIATADRDLCQLASPHITILATRGQGVSDVHHFDPDAVFERFGVPPERLPDWKGLVGDSSDNIPGVPGIGPKTATLLLSEHGTLDAVLDAAESMKGKRRENLLEFRDQALLSRDLATIRTDLPLAATPDSLRRRDIDEEAVARVLTELELHGLMRRLSPRSATPPPGLSYRSVDDDQTAARVAEEVREARTVGLAWRSDLPGVAVATGAARAWFFPLASGGGTQMALFHDQGAGDEQRRRLELGLAPLADGSAGFVAHDLQTLYGHLGAASPLLREPRGDTHLASWLLDPDRPNHPLDMLGQRHLGAPPPDLPPGHPDPGAFQACFEADLCRRIEPRLREELGQDKLLDLYLRMELPLAPVLARMMAVGVVVDRAGAAALDGELGGAIGELRALAYAAAGREFNLDSPKQLGEILFDELGLPPGRKTKTGYSTDAATLQGLVDRHPIVERILHYRELAKLKSTYTEVLLNLSDPDTGRIHTSLNQTGAVTGRLSSSNPNLQNIPVRGDWGERVRDLFCVPDGWRMLAADYSQIELRVLAHVSADKRMMDAFRHGEDIHAAAAQEIFGIAPEAITADQRRMAKVLNFGIAYGIQPHGLSQRLEIAFDEARALIEAYFTRFPAVKQYADDTIRRAREQGFVQTMFGRRRRLADIHSKNPNLRQAAERAAINMPIQGAASDIIKLAMLALDERLRQERCESRLILQVHDELLLECPPAEQQPVADLVRRCMVEAAELDVPLEVKIEVGERWASLEPMA